MSSPLDLGGGWYARPRSLTAWPLYQSLGALGRRLVDVLLERARWQAGEVWILGHRVELQAGQLIDSEEELARLCGRGTSRKVVRTALHRLAEGGFLDRRPALPAGQCPYIITVRDYALLRRGLEQEGPRKGPPDGAARDNEGPSAGPAGAPVEQGNSINNVNKGEEAPAALCGEVGSQPLLPKAEVLGRQYPATQRLLEALAKSTPPLFLEHARDRATRQRVEKLAAQAPLDLAVDWVRAGHAREGKPFVGWYADDLAQAAQGRELRRGAAADPVPVIDLSWFAGLAPEPRGAAEAEFEAKRVELERDLAPATAHRMLAAWADSMRARYAA